MTAFEVYNLFLCFFVFIGFTGVFSVMLFIIVNSTLKLIKAGIEDEKIKTEYAKMQKSKNGGIVDTIISILLCAVVFVVFGFSVVVGFMPDKVSGNLPTVRVVNSGSMATKNEENEYLFENNINDQIQTFDLILTYKLPKEEDLKLYDIVVYEVDGILVMHRIVGIEEPCYDHPNQRWFLLQGDAVANPDRFPVKYSQMQSIYRGERIPFIGSFVSFMQSPAGWLCIMLVIIAVIVTPILEKKINKAKNARLAIILQNETTEQVEKQEETNKNVENEEIAIASDDNAFSIARRDFRDFKQKLADSNEAVKERYNSIYSLIARIKGVRVIESKKQQSFKKGNDSIIRMIFRGKTLCALLALNPKDYENSKYIFNDFTDVKAHANYPMCMRLTSDRQARWTIELLNDLIVKNGYELEELPQIIEVVPEISEEALDMNNRIIKRDFRDFKQKLEDSTDVIKDRYNSIYSLIARINGVRVIESKKQQSFKKGNTPIVRFTFRGKTLCALLGLDVKEYENSKYIFKDFTEVKAHANYPMCMRLTSDRQARWVIELLNDLIIKNGYELSELPKPIEVEPEIIEEALDMQFRIVKRDFRDFNQKLEDSTGVVKDRYNSIYSLVARIKDVRVIESKKQKSFKKGSYSIIRMIFRGKTLCALLALNPTEYENTKYIFKDFTEVKAHANYPMCMRLTSDRQARWVIELLNEIIAKNGYELEELPKPIEVESEIIEEELDTGLSIVKRDFRTFNEKLEDSNDAVKDRYDSIYSLVARIKGVRIIESKKQKSFKKGNDSVARLAFRGKTLCALLALNPKEYENTKYIFKDFTEVKAHANYPMRVKLSSERQARWTCELLNDLIVKQGYELNELPKPIEELTANDEDKFNIVRRDFRDFNQKLKDSTEEIKERYNSVYSALSNINGVRVIESKKQKYFKKGNSPIARITFRGKTLCVLLALNPNDYENTKYKFKNVSDVNKYSLTPMRIKLTSNRQVKHAIELIESLLNGFNKGE